MLDDHPNNRPAKLERWLVTFQEVLVTWQQLLWIHNWAVQSITMFAYTSKYSTENDKDAEVRLKHVYDRRSVL